MKKIIIENIVKGGAFGIGLLIVIAIWGWGESSFFEEKLDDESWREIETSNAKVKTDRIVEYATMFTILATVTNVSDFELESVRVEADLFDTAGLFGSCTKFAKNLKPKGQQEITIECYNFRTDQIPEDTKVELHISEVYVGNKS
jgi:hypothetical protein